MTEPLDTVLGWRAKIFRTVQLSLPIQFGFAHATRNPAGFALDLDGVEMDWDAYGHSPADYALNLPLAMYFMNAVPREFGLHLDLDMSFEARERYLAQKFGLTLPIKMPSTAREHYGRNFRLNLPVSLRPSAVGRSVLNPRWLSSTPVSGTATTGSISATDLVATWSQQMPPSAVAAIVDFWHELSYTGTESIPEFDIEIDNVPCQILANLLYFEDRTERLIGPSTYSRVQFIGVAHTISDFSDIIDVVGLGPGCGGNAGGFGASGGGSGGGAGQWNARRLVRGVDFAENATGLQIIATLPTGSGGASGANAIAGPPAAFGVYLGSTLLFTCNGGAVGGGGGYANWGNAGTYTFQGNTYASAQSSGGSPGCGGVGGNSTIIGGNAGTAGGHSCVWIREWENERHYRRRLVKAVALDAPHPPQAATPVTTKVIAKTSPAARQQISGRTSFVDNILNLGPVVSQAEPSRMFADNFQRANSNDLGPNWVQFDGPAAGSARATVGIVNNTARPIGDVGGRVYLWHRPLSRKDIYVHWKIGGIGHSTPNPEYYLILGCDAAGHCVTIYFQTTSAGLSNIYLRSSLNTNFASLNQQTQRAASLTTVPANAVISVTRINGVYRVYSNETHVTQLTWDSRVAGGNDSTIHPIDPMTYGFVGFSLYSYDNTRVAMLQDFLATDLV